MSEQVNKHKKQRQILFVLCKNKIPCMQIPRSTVVFFLCGMVQCPVIFLVVCIEILRFEDDLVKSVEKVALLFCELTGVKFS